jgi:hypothetical protein
LFGKFTVTIVRRAMEFASIDEVFPPNSISASSQKFPPTDADRPAVKRMSDIEPIRRATEVPDEMLDASEQFQKRTSVGNTMPSPKSIIALEKAQLPSYFGAEAFTNPNEDVLAPFNNSRDEKGFMLDVDFTQTFDQPGLGRAGGTSLPVPELRHRWKHLSNDHVETSQVEPNTRSGQIESTDMRYMKSKIDALIARLDDIESRAAGANPQLELLSFIMTGLFLMFMVDLAVRKSVTMKLN